MKKINIIRFGEKLVNAAETFRDKADMIGSYLAILCFVSVIVAGMYGVVQGQSGTYIDVPGTYEADQNMVVAVTGDEGQNVQTLDSATRTAAGVDVAVALLGPGVAGPTAQARAEELGIPASSRNGLLGVVDQEAMALLSNPPGISITSHFANQWVPGHESQSTTVYAQGDDTEGAEFLSDFVHIEEIWEMFRNLAYAGFVLVIMVAGFMIMFRSRIDGQTTVNIMNSLPSVLVGLLLVTFSFAIAGFIIDIGRLISGVLESYMSSNLGGFQPKALNGPLRLAWYAFESVNPIGNSLSGGVFSGGFMRMMFLFTNPITGIVMLIVTIVLAGICLYAAFKVFFMLVMTYIKIFIDVILGPVYIVLGSLPGKSKSRTDWLKRIMAGALVFPVAFLIINVGRYIGENSAGSGFIGAVQYLGGGEASDPIINISGVFVIAAYLIAAGTPGIVNDILDIQPGKGVDAAMKGAQAAAGKIPLVGGFFGG